MSNQKTEVRFPPHLRRFLELPEVCQATGETVREIVNNLDNQFPGFADYLLHENGEVRQHVNIFLDEKMISDRKELSDSVDDINQIFIMQALSGG